MLIVFRFYLLFSEASCIFKATALHRVLLSPQQTSRNNSHCVGLPNCCILITFAWNRPIALAFVRTRGESADGTAWSRSMLSLAMAGRVVAAVEIGNTPSHAAQHSPSQVIRSRHSASALFFNTNLVQFRRTESMLRLTLPPSPTLWLLGISVLHFRKTSSFCCFAESRAVG